LKTERSSILPSPGRTSVVITTNEGGCEFDADAFVMVLPPMYEIPELITPNGDNVNDEFRVYKSGQVTDYTMIIFNRWGQQVFSSTNPDEAWDGTKNGTPQNSDIYLYVTKFRLNGAEINEEGQFNLVR